MHQDNLLLSSNLDEVKVFLDYLKTSFFKWETSSKTISINGWASKYFSDNPKAISIDKVFDLIHQEDGLTIRDQIARLSNGTIKKIDYKFRISNLNDNDTWVRLVVEKSQNGDAFGLIIDVTEEHKVMASNLLNVNLYYATLELSNISGLYIPLIEGTKTVYFFASLFDHFDIDQSLIKYREKHHYTDIDVFRNIIHPDDLIIFDELLNLAQSSTISNYEENVKFRLKNKSYKWFKLVVSKRLTPYGEGIICAITDIDDSLNHLHDAQYEAIHDSLTYAKNRVALRDYRIDNDKSIALLLLDLDDFKDINDIYGHDAGDIVLISIVEKLSHIFGGEHVYRLGGDEFIIIVENYDDRTLRYLIDKTIESIGEPIIRDFEKYVVQASMGVALKTKSRTIESLATLLKEADYALYDAKEIGKNTTIIADANRVEKYRQREILERNIHNAFKNKEIIATYMPIVDNKNNKVMGIEALARWEHKGQSIPANEFIRISKKLNLMHQLDLTVIELTLDLYSDLIKNNYVDEDFKIFINLSSSSLKHMDPETLVYLVKSRSLNPSNIYFEITEEFILDKHVKGACEELKHMGFNLVLDDYYSGHTALDYLLDSNFDFVKINQKILPSFNEIKTPKDEKYEKLYFHLIEMIQHLGINVICEGIETDVQKNAISNKGITYMQGFNIAKQLTDKELIKFLKRK